VQKSPTRYALTTKQALMDDSSPINIAQIRLGVNVFLDNNIMVVHANSHHPSRAGCECCSNRMTMQRCGSQHVTSGDENVMEKRLSTLNTTSNFIVLKTIFIANTIFPLFHFNSLLLQHFGLTLLRATLLRCRVFLRLVDRLILASFYKGPGFDSPLTMPVGMFPK
jgi:hypothetical protein